MAGLLFFIVLFMSFANLFNSLMTFPPEFQMLVKVGRAAARGATRRRRRRRRFEGLCHSCGGPGARHGGWETTSRGGGATRVLAGRG